LRRVSVAPRRRQQDCPKRGPDSISQSQKNKAEEIPLPPPVGENASAPGMLPIAGAAHSSCKRRVILTMRRVTVSKSAGF